MPGKNYEREKVPNPDKTFKKQIRQEAREKFKGGQIIKKHKLKNKNYLKCGSNDFKWS